MSSTTPSVNEDQELPTASQSESWESVGRELLRARLEEVSEETVRTGFCQATQRIANGDALTKQDIQAMRTALHDAERVLKVAARASPEAAPLPDPWQFLDEDAKSEYVEAVERRKDESTEGR